MENVLFFEYYAISSSGQTVCSTKPIWRKSPNILVFWPVASPKR